MWVGVGPTIAALPVAGQVGGFRHTCLPSLLRDRSGRGHYTGNERKDKANTKHAKLQGGINYV